MAFLGKIIEKIQNELKVEIHGNFSENKFIDGVKLIGENGLREKTQCPDILYIGAYEDCRFLDIKESLLMYNAPIINTKLNKLFIKENVPIIDLINAVETETCQYRRMKYKREILFESLYSGYGIEGLLNIAYEYLSSPITLCDTSFSVIGSRPPLKDYDNFDVLNNRLFLKEEKIQNMKKQHIIEHLHNSSLPIYIKLEKDEPKMVFQSVKINNSIVAYLFTQEVKCCFNEEDLEYLQVLAQMISIELQKENTFRKSSSYKYEFFMSQLLDGEFEEFEYVSRQLHTLGHKLNPYHYVVIANSIKEVTISRLQNYCEQLKKLFPNSMVIIYKNYITMILGVDVLKEYKESVEEKLQTFLEFNSLSAGISYPFADILQAPRYFEQIESLYSMASINPNVGKIINYEDYFIHQLLINEHSPDRLYALIHPHVKSILHYDREHNTDYTDTLIYFISANRNASLAANHLFIHKSTFFYRINKMAELFNIDITDSKLLFAYEFSLYILEYINSLEQL